MYETDQNDNLYPNIVLTLQRYEVAFRNKYHNLRCINPLYMLFILILFVLYCMLRIIIIINICINVYYHIFYWYYNVLNNSNFLDK